MTMSALDEAWPEHCPRPPEFLCGAGQAEWRRQAPALYRLGHLQPLYEGPFAVYCCAYGHWATIENVLGKLPDDQPPQARVLLVKMARRAARQVIAYAGNFYLQPSVRVLERAGESDPTASSSERQS